MQPLVVYHFCNLIRPHPSVLARKAVKYSFFYFHLFLSYFAKSSKKSEIWRIIDIAYNQFYLYYTDIYNAKLLIFFF